MIVVECNLLAALDFHFSARQVTERVEVEVVKHGIENFCEESSNGLKLMSI